MESLSGEEFDRYFTLEDEIITKEFCCDRSFISIGRIKSCKSLTPDHLLFDWQGRVVALKRGQCIPPTEIEIMKKIGTHPYIVQFIAEVEGGLLIEGIEKGLTLNKYCYYGSDRKALSLEICIRLMKQVASALKHLHDLGIIYHDLTDKNVLVDLSQDMPILKLCDFGISEMVDENGNGSEENRTAGTVSHMAPEQDEKSNYPITNKIDVYSFSSICMAILSRGRSFEEVLNKVPINLNQLLSICRKKNPEKRPTMDEILKVLEKPNLAQSETFYSIISESVESYNKEGLPIPGTLEELCQDMSAVELKGESTV